MDVWTKSRQLERPAKRSYVKQTSARCEETEASPTACALEHAVSALVCEMLRRVSPDKEHDLPTLLLAIPVERLDDWAVQKCDKECEVARDKDKVDTDTFVPFPIVRAPLDHLASKLPRP